MALWNGIIVTSEEFCSVDLLRLAEHGIKPVYPDWTCISLEAWHATREARFDVNATQKDAPRTFSCVTFMSWILELAGMRVLPKLEIATFGLEVKKDDLQPGDLLFVAGLRKRFDHPHGWIGHVGIYNSFENVLHATRREDGEGVFEDSLEDFVQRKGPIVTIRRLIADKPLITLACSAEKWTRDPPQDCGAIRKYVDNAEAWFNAMNIVDV